MSGSGSSIEITLRRVLTGPGRDTKITQLLLDIHTYALLRAFQRKSQEDSKKTLSPLAGRFLALLSALKHVDDALDRLSAQDVLDIGIGAASYWFRMKPAHVPNPLLGQADLALRELRGLGSPVKRLIASLGPASALLAPRRKKGRPVTALRAELAIEVLSLLDRADVPASVHAQVLTEALYSAGFNTPERIDLLISQARREMEISPRSVPSVEAG